MEISKIAWELASNAQWTVLYDEIPVINTETTNEHKWRVVAIHNQELAAPLIQFMEDNAESLLIGERAK